MTPSHDRPFPHPRTCLALLLCAALWSCGQAPVEPAPPAASPDAAQQAPAPAAPVSLALPPSALRDEFDAVEAALGEFDWMRAEVALDALSGGGMTAADAAYVQYLRARVALIRGLPQRALELLGGIHGPGVGSALEYRVLALRHYILALAGDFVDSARIAGELLTRVPADRVPAWRRVAWHDLQRADAATLRSALETATDPQWIAWLQLALDAREPQDALDTAVRAWLARYPNHPAADPLPGGMGFELANPAPGAGPGGVAIILPLSGRLAPAGEAVLDGYLAAYYAARERGAAPGQVLVLDELAFADSAAAYDAAVARGAQLVIGPLAKESVAELATRLERPVPVLALNHIQEVLPASGSALVQLALAPEDEIDTLAERAYGSGARQAMIIRPADDWGEKMERELRRRWSQLGGRVVSAAAYTGRDDYSRSVKDALGLSASEERARRVRDMLATNIEFTARRRRDPDIVFLLCRDGEEARSIKPLLAFHYAGDVPVYALSTIYDGLPDERNRDLSGITLVEMPWLLGASPELRVAIAAGDGGGDFTRLNALGADAFLLQSSFPRLQAGADALLRGNTGLLSMDPRLRIRRELSLATFDGGVITPK